jgi:PKD repeat protein
VADWNGTAPVAGTAKVLTNAGTGWASRAMFGYQGNALPPINPAPNVAPTAAATVSCLELVCSFDGSTSKDSDGTIASYAWNFGDGTTGTGQTASHTYSAAGAQTVTLTVTDNSNATGSTTFTAEPKAAPAPSQVAFVDASTSSGNRSTHSVTIPTTVQPGDQLLLFFTANSTTPKYTLPTDWTVLHNLPGDAATGIALARTATAGDAGRDVSITTTTTSATTGAPVLTAYKDVMTVAAYRGGSVTGSTSVADASDTTKRTTPAITAPNSQQWLVSYWSDKGSNTLTWTTPSTVTRRGAPLGSGSGHTSAVLGDSNGTVASGSQGSLAATTDAVGTAAFNFSVLLG